MEDGIITMNNFKQYLKEKFMMVDILHFIKIHKLPKLNLQDIELSGEWNVASKEKYNGDLPGVVNLHKTAIRDVKVEMKMLAIASNIVPYIRVTTKSSDATIISHFKYTAAMGWIPTTKLA
jgi:hypothetical protein